MLGQSLAAHRVPGLDQVVDIPMRDVVAQPAVDDFVGLLVLPVKTEPRLVEPRLDELPGGLLAPQRVVGDEAGEHPLAFDVPHPLRQQGVGQGFAETAEEDAGRAEGLGFVHDFFKQLHVHDAFQAVHFFARTHDARRVAYIGRFDPDFRVG